MKKAVITTGGKQYLVSKGDEIDVELVSDKSTKLTFEPLLVIDGDKVEVGTPSVKDAKVKAEVLGEVRGKKTSSIRYKAKKRIRKVHGHKQSYAQLKISSIEG